MAIDPERLRSMRMPVIEQGTRPSDAMFHALSLGYSPAAGDSRELDFVYERALRVAPSLALVWCFRSLSTLDLGIDYRKVVHAAQALRLHALLPAEATISSESRIDAVWDLGADKGALLEVVRELRNKATGQLLATTRMSALCRGDGGFGGAPPPARVPWRVEGQPDRVFTWRTSAEQAALYRLQGDLNPLHIDPERARAAGFERPILHGLATFGGCVRAVLATSLGYDVAMLRSIEGRFTAPLYPGETLQVEIWHEANGRLLFQARAVERDVLVMRDGTASAD